MAYGEIKVDTITFTDGGIDKSVSISGLVQNPTFSGNITVTGTISGDTLQGQTVSGVTVTGTTAQFTSGTFTSITGTTATITSGVFASGTAAAPSVSIGTTNNGLYSPGTNQVAISTSGTGALFVDSSGKVGIGIAPAQKLDILTGTYRAFFDDGASANGFRIRCVNAANSAVGPLQLGGEDVRLLSGTALNERLRITSDGKLGLGTSSPQGTLNVQGGGTSPSLTYDTNDIANFDAGGVQFAVGINSSSPFGAFLQARDNANAARAITLNPAGGNVGIGTTSPIGLLSVSSGASVGTISADADELFIGNNGNAGMTIGASTNSKCTIAFAEQGVGTDRGKIVYDTNDESLQFFAANAISERARIDSSGRLLLGTSTSVNTFGVAPRLQIAGNESYQSNIAYRADAFAPFISVGHSRNATVGSQTILQSGDDFGTFAFVGSDGTGLIQGASIKGQVDGTPGANDMPGRLIFATTADGASTPTERMRITSDGKLGLGTSSPAALCHLRSDANSAVTHLYLQNRNAGASAQSRIAFTNSANDLSDNRHAYIGAVTTGAGQNGNSFVIATNQNGDSAQERVWVSSAGNVGIGTTSPSQSLQVNGNALIGATPATQYSNFTVVGTSGIQAAAPLFNLTNAAGSTRFAYIQHTGAGGDIYFLNQENGAFRIGTNNAERVRIDSSGNVGIGTTTVRSGLHIYGAGQTTATISDSGDRAAFLRVSQSGSATGTGGGILFASQQGDNANSAGFAAIKGLLTDGSNNTAGTLAFSVRGTSSASTMQEAMRIDGSGRLLVGTSSAGAYNGYSAGNLLQISSGEADIQLASFRADQFGSVVNLGKSRSATVGANAAVQANDWLGTINFNGANGTAWVSGARITAFAEGQTWANNDCPTYLTFSTTADGASSPTERMRISQSGRVSTYSTDGTANIITSSLAAGTSNRIVSLRRSSTGINSGTEVLLVYTNGDVQNTNNTYGGISDIKLKENIVDANSQWDDLKALQVRNYNFKEGQTHTQIGLIAQEAELVSPGLVSESPDRDEDGNDLGTVTKSVNYSVLYMKAVKALQEAMERIEVLEQRLADAGIA